LPHINVDKKNDYVMKNSECLNYERLTYIKDLTVDDEFGNSIQNLKFKDIPMYYFDSDESSSPNLEFSDSLYQVKINKTNSENSSIILINKNDKSDSVDLSRNTYQRIKSRGLYSIKFGGSKENNPIIDISKEDRHVFLELKTKENEDSRIFLKVVTVFVLTLFGICIPFLLSEFARKIRMKI